MYGYDHIPKGKKPFRDPQTGEVSLIDLEVDNVDDLRTMLDERDATIKELEAEVANLKVQIGKKK